MTRFVMTAWDGGGNVVVERELARRLVERGHHVHLVGPATMVEGFRTVGARTTATDPWGPTYLDDLAAAVRETDVVLPDLMVSRHALAAIEASGRPAGVVVHTMWSFVPHLDGADRMMGAGYLDQLARFDALLVCSIAELDDDTPRLTNVRHVGPVLEGEGPDAGWMPPARSLVVVSLGTTDLGEGPVLQRVLDALADAPVDVIATVGAHLDPASLRLPANARVSGFTRHAALLAHADVFVGHGGHGGIMAALAFGVPVVSIPLDRDQPHNAARVAAVGAGRTVARDATAEEIRSTVLAVRSGERERATAMRLANAIAGHGHAAVEAVESLGR